MKLRLISPDEEFEYIMWQDDKAPAVVIGNAEDGSQRVWVKGSSSTHDNLMYFEQRGVVELYTPSLKKVK